MKSLLLVKIHQQICNIVGSLLTCTFQLILLKSRRFSHKNHKNIYKIIFFFQKYLVNSKKSSTFALGFETNQVFLAQLVEQLTLNQWVQGSSPWEDTKDIRRVSFFCIMFADIKKM